MPSIDLSRLRKQVVRLTDFFFLPDEFTRLLNSMLDSYVNYTIRRRPAQAHGANLPTYHVPPVILMEIEQELQSIAADPENADASLALADRLWDEGWLETRLLAAFLLGRITPEEGRLSARLTAWISQVRDPELRSRLLDSSLVRMRKDTPEEFLHLIREWLLPQRMRYWPDAIHAAIAALKDPEFRNVPYLLDVMEPAIRAAPSQIQLDLEELILVLYQVSPTETSYFIRNVLMNSDEPMTAITFRRIASSLPVELQEEIREFVRGKPLSLP